MLVENKVGLGKAYVNDIFALRQIVQKVLEKRKVYVKFMDLKMAYDKVKRNALLISIDFI